MPDPGPEQMLVHNLKTPLTGIMAALEMLLDGDFGGLTAAQRQVVEVMQAQGGDLLEMIEELLELGSLAAPGLSVRLGPVDLAAVVPAVAAEWTPRFQGRLASEPGGADQVAMADDRILRRVLGNLLMNASIHGGSGVAVSIRVEVAGHRAVAIMVEDDGPGIATADSERIFQPFVRLGANAPSGRRTSGLGLAYCRAAVVAMGGTIALVPSDRGASFRIELPVATPASVDAQP
jgi:two-component system sensor histidine kinase GlrK